MSREREQHRDSNTQKPRNDQKEKPQQNPDYSSIIKKAENEPPRKRDKDE